MGRIATIWLACLVGAKCWAEAPDVPRPSSLTTLRSVWQSQVPVARSTDIAPRVMLHVSPTRTIAVYEVVSGGQRTVFTGPGAERDADIERRVRLMSGREATVELRAIPVATLLVQTPGGRVEALDAETGTRRWSVGISTGAPGQCSFPAAMNDEYVAAISGSRLYVMEAQSGKLLFDRRMTDAPGAGPVVLGSRAYVPSMRGPLKVYELAEEGRQFPPFTMTSFGRIASQPLRTPQRIVWATDRGTVFVSDDQGLASGYQILGRTATIGDPAVADGRLFVAYENGYLLCADAESGSTLWGFLADAGIAAGPFVADDVVLVPTVESRLFAVDVESGQEVWVAPGVTRATGYAGDIVFGETVDRQLVMLDRQTGTKRGLWRLRIGERPIANTVSDRIYLASAGGSLRCLRLPQAKWPTFYAPQQPASYPSAEQPPEDEQTAKTATPSEESKPVKTDEPPKVEEPFPAAPATDEDPFGAGDPFGESGDPFAAGEGDPF